MICDEDEQSLFCELIVLLTIRLVELSSYGKYKYHNGMALKGCEIDDEGLSAYQAATDILVRSDVVDPHPKFRTYKVKFDVPELRADLIEGAQSHDVGLSEVIEAYLEMTSDYGDHQPVTTERAAFPVPAGFDRAFDLLCRCGYAETVGDKVKWTDKIAPQMRAIYRWTEDGVSEEELYEVEIEEMWRTMPPRILEVFFSGGTVDVLSLGIVISRFWYDGKWQDIDLDNGKKEVIIRGGAAGKAKDLAKKFRGSGN